MCLLTVQCFFKDKVTWIYPVCQTVSASAIIQAKDTSFPPTKIEITHRSP